jgi:tRNA(Arg) A34 adenosine deaminase TadA
MQPDAEIMKLLIEAARSNHQAGGHAVAAAIVRGEDIISTGVTTIDKDNDPTAHAEVNAIRAAAIATGSRFLDGCYLYTTFEPCPMCTSAAVWAKLKGIVYGATMKDQTARCPQRINIPAEMIAQHGTPTLEIVSEFMRDECVQLLGLS